AADETTALAPSAQHESGEVFRAPLAYGLLLAPWAALGSARGALCFQSLLLAAAVLLAARSLVRRLGSDAAWLPLLLLLGSTLFACAMRLWSDVALAALVTIAFALAIDSDVVTGHAPALGELPEVYPEDVPPQRQPRFVLRWLAVGALLRAAASAGWWLLPLLVPAALAVPRQRRRAGVLALLGAALAVLLIVAAIGAATAHARPAPEEFGRALGWSLPSWEGLGTHLLAWDAVHLLAGRHIGLLFYCGPLLLLVALGVRRWLWAAVAVSVLLLVLLRPFDLAGSTFTIGLRAFLPLYAALWLSPLRAPSRTALVLAALWSAAWVWPLLRAPRTALDEHGSMRYAAPYLAPWAPLETTQTALRFGGRMPFGNGKLVLVGGEPIGRGRVAAVPAGRWVEILAGVPGETPGFWVEGGEQAGNELPVRGGSVTETMFRPDGGISFLVRPKRSYTRHRMPGA